MIKNRKLFMNLHLLNVIKECLSNELKSQSKNSLDVGLWMNADRSMVQTHNLSRKAEPDTRTTFFGGKKGNEYLLDVLGRDTRSVISDLDDYFTSSDQIGLHVDPAAFLSGSSMKWIKEEVYQNLLDEFRIGGQF